MVGHEQWSFGSGEEDVMATGRSSFAKRQRDMAKKAKASAKRDRKLEKNDDDLDGEEEETVDDTPPNDVVMEKIADLHRRYDDGGMDLDTFDELKAELMAQMVID